MTIVAPKKVLALPEKPKETTSSGFHLPDQAKERPSVGKVVSFGEDVEGIKKDDLIHYSAYRPDKITIASVEYDVLSVHDILAIERDDGVQA